MKREKRVRRTFSTAFKKEKVELVESGRTTVRELSIVYEVSQTAIYNWIKEYSKYGTSEHIVVEKISEAKKNIELMNRIRNLEQAIGRKQMELDYYKTLVEVIREEAGGDVEKKDKPK